MTTNPDSFKSRKTLKVGSKAYAYFSLPAAEKNGLKGISRLPYSMKVLLENLLRHENRQSVIASDIKAIVYEMRFDEASARYAEFGPFFTGLVLDPADALARAGVA